MLTQNEARLVDEYLLNHYTLSKRDEEYLDEIDNLILDCSLDFDYSKLMKDELLDTARQVQRRMNALYILDEGCSPRVLAYQEKFYSLLYLHKKANSESGIAELAMQCFTSSFDLFWMQTVATIKES